MVTGRDRLAKRALAVLRQNDTGLFVKPGPRGVLGAADEAQELTAARLRRAFSP
jgi:hypothetical protein